ncbi:isopropylmalate synthase [Streptomyces sp. NPDC101150]|uniref:isopropylmalate synthase n=1 Tax=Streptomyces sp. NPDC101150 TaxID=3366114 RepID=UPI003827F60A
MTSADDHPDRDLPGVGPLPRVSDATLRDSAHMAGVEFAPADVRVVAGLLRDAGVHLIEVGMVSGPGGEDAPLVRAAHETVGPDRCLTLVTVRTRKQAEGALRAAADLGCRSVMLSIPTSVEHSELKLGSPSTRYLIRLASSVIAEAKAHGFHVTFSGEDAARADSERLVEYVGAGFDAGADRFRLAETVASLTASEISRRIRDIKGASSCREVEVHCHNMLGMAVGNSLAAYEAGADWISATVGGIGERGGNTPLAELLCALRVCYGDPRYVLGRLGELLDVVRESARIPSFTPGPLTEYAFAYEVAGQLSHPEAYESLPPEAVGGRRTVRVRSRISSALLSCVLQDEGHDLDVDAFATWLGEHQKATGYRVLGREDISALAQQFSTTGPFPPSATRCP